MKTYLEDCQPTRSMSFTELLDEYLERKATGPDEEDGYTDKGYYRRVSEIQDAMNCRVDSVKELQS